MNLSWCSAPDTGLPRPDLVVFLHVSPEEAARRGGFGEERYEKRDVQERVRGLFGEVGGLVGEDWRVVDAGGSVEGVHGEVRRVVGECLERVEREGGPLRVVGE